MARGTTISDETTGGNVFADLGRPRPEQELLKADLTLHPYRVIKARRVTQTQAGEILGIMQPRSAVQARSPVRPEHSAAQSICRLRSHATLLLAVECTATRAVGASVAPDGRPKERT